MVAGPLRALALLAVLSVHNAQALSALVHGFRRASHRHCCRSCPCTGRGCAQGRCQSSISAGMLRVGRRSSFKPIAYAFLLQYRHEQDLATVMDLVDNELSEPYSIFTYRCSSTITSAISPTPHAASVTVVCVHLVPDLLAIQQVFPAQLA